MSNDSAALLYSIGPVARMVLLICGGKWIDVAKGKPGGEWDGYGKLVVGGELRVKVREKRSS